MKEEDIRPSHIFDEYLKLAADDTKFYFSDVPRENISCPACGGAGDFTFHKNGFDYEECPDCQTLYVNPRPLASAFTKYYTESPSTEYWATTFYKETAESRRRLLWKPKARLILETTEKWINSEKYKLLDIGGGYGIFSEEIRALTGDCPIVIEPGPSLANVCRNKGLVVIEKFLEDVKISDLPEGQKVYVSFELFEHLHSPEAFLRSLSALMSPGDLFIFTTLSGTGVDIRVLWENSKSVSPPHHLNFLNPFSVPNLLQRVGLESLEISTPGKLDIDILSNSESDINDRFWKSFVSTASVEQKKSFQIIIENCLCSSHMMVVCRKPE